MTDDLPPEPGLHTADARRAEHTEQMRLFVAVELPHHWLQALADVQERMKGALAADPALAGVRLRWVRPEAIHLTLKFIGEVGADRLPPIAAQLSRAVPAKPDSTLSLGRAGTFQDRRAPRVLWAGVHDEPPRSLLDLAQGIDTWLASAGIPRERRAFQPHLTLARLPEGLSDAQRRRAADLTAAVQPGEKQHFSVESVSLIRSFLGPGGARYERLGRWPN